MRTISVWCFSFTLVFLSASFFHAPPAQAIDACMKATSDCGGGQGCVGPFSSLAITSSLLECFGDGWTLGPTPCGIKTCYLVLQCPCGNRHSTNVCDGTGQEACECEALDGAPTDGGKTTSPAPWAKESQP